MAQGDVLLNSDGTVALDSTGKVRLVDASSDCPDCCVVAPCTDCDPTGAGAAPKLAEVINVADGTKNCSATNGNVGSGGYTSTSNYCLWTWDSGPAYTIVYLWYAINDITDGISLTNLIPAGTWRIEMKENLTAFGDSVWSVATTNFACDPVTGRVSGTQYMGAAAEGVHCGGTPTITVDP